MKRTIKTLDTLIRLADELREGLENEEFDVVASLVADVSLKAILLAARHQGQKTRRTWVQIRQVVPELSPPLKRDYTTVIEEARKLDKDARYAEDGWDFDEDEVRSIAEQVLDLVDDVRKMAS